MSEPKFIKTEEYSTTSQKYDVLLSRGIELIEKFSGENWTDYNYHDPGITILEQICFAITDLGYKSNFPITDLLLINKDKFDLESSNLFIPPKKIFSCSPTTINDYRKLIIDDIENVKNAWFVVKENHKLGIQGIFSLKIQVSENLERRTINETIQSVEELIMQNRAISTDIDEINVLKKDIISIGGNITIDSFVVGEEVLANIFRLIESKINKELVSHNFNEKFDEGNSLEDLYSGPITKKGYIDENDLVDKTNEIFISELKEIILSINGTLEIKDFTVYKNGIKITDDYVNFNENSYPSLVSIDKYFSKNNDGNLKFFRNENEYLIDQVIFSQIYESFKFKNLISSKKSLDDFNTKTSRFTKGEIEKYYSIMREFPSIYGLNEGEISTKSNELRKSQVNQLKGYLSLFEQLMANHLSQLVNTRNYFSVKNSNKTFFSQYLSNVPGFSEIIDFDNKSSYNKFLDNISESKSKFFLRKEKILDHMLSRFGETYDTQILGKLYQIQNSDESIEKTKAYELDAKSNYAQKILKFRSLKNIGFNYQKNQNNSDYYSGLEKILKLILNIKKRGISPNLKNYTNGSNEIISKNIWQKKSVKLDEKTFTFYSLPGNCYLKNKVNFRVENILSHKDIFHNGINLKSYLIKKINKKFALFYFSKSKSPDKISESMNYLECRNTLNRVIKRLKKLSDENEGFYMIENILLRPIKSSNNILYLLNENKEKLFETFFDLKISEIDEISDDLNYILSKKENYVIEKNYSNRRFKIIIYNDQNLQVFKSCKNFVSYNEAKKVLTSFLKNFDVQDLDNRKILKQEESLFHKFPDNFKFSNEVNFIFPDWPFRFQNIEFKNYIKKNISDLIPSHVKFKIHYININDLLFFDKLHKKWLNSKKNKNQIRSQSLSLELIQILIKFKENG